ncbi:MAG: undecaprenyl-diphosphate phosphatase [Clostridia bacterium]|nr:undecaprenyl-diphosphate phosphatase [Clostridia bacterium]
MFIIEIIKAVILGIIEGITEWLPISSTGHMILIDEFLHLDVSPEFLEMFFVVIQLGAICAVPLLFWDRLYPLSRKKTKEENKAIWNIWGKVIVGAVPAAVLGLLLDDLLDTYLYNYIVVAIALVIYGVAFIFVEKFKAENKYRIENVEDIGYIDALKIGAFQVLSLIPGTSRSGSTILGGMVSGVSRKASAEFSFFMAIPIMLGASGLKVLKFLLEGFSASGKEIALLIVGIVVSFLVSFFVIKFLMDFVKRHDFKVFGYYRITLGALVLIYFAVKSLIS